MTVLVTGAGGFLGRRVEAALVERGLTVRALVRRPVEGVFDASTEVVTGDLRRAADVPALLEGVDTVVHLAAVVAGGATAQFSGTVTATENLLAGMKESQVERLVLSSSFSVYDWSEISGQLDENSPLEADLATRDGYAAAKLWQERICRRAAEDARWSLTVLRPGFIWGAGGGEWVWGVGVQAGGVVLVVGSRKPLPLTHVDNCADAFATVVTDPRTQDGTYNIVDDYRVTPLRYGRAVADWRGGRVVVVPHGVLRTTGVLASDTLRALSGRPARLPALFDPHLFVARFKPLDYPPSRLITSVGWQPPYSWEDCLTRTFGRKSAGPRPSPEYTSPAPGPPTEGAPPIRAAARLSSTPDRVTTCLPGPKNRTSVEVGRTSVPRSFWLPYGVAGPEVPAKRSSWRWRDGTRA